MGTGCKIENNEVEKSKNLDAAMLATPLTLLLPEVIDSVKARLTGKELSLDRTNSVGMSIREAACKYTGEKGRDRVDNMAGVAGKTVDTFITPFALKAWVLSYDLLTLPMKYVNAKLTGTPSSTKK